MAAATIGQLRDYLQFLNRQHRDRHAADPRIPEVKALIKLVSRHAKKHRGITVGDAVQMEVEKAATKKTK